MVRLGAQASGAGVMNDDETLRLCADRIETLLRDVEAIAGPVAWPRVQSLVTALVDLYGAGLGRVLDHAGECVRDRAELDRRLAADEVVASLLALHDLHPIPLEQRVERALDRARAQLSSDAIIELAEIRGGVASVRVSGAESGSGVVLTQLVARAIEHDAPEIGEVHVDGAPPPASPKGENIVSVARLVHKARPST